MIPKRYRSLAFKAAVVALAAGALSACAEKPPYALGPVAGNHINGSIPVYRYEMRGEHQVVVDARTGRPLYRIWVLDFRRPAQPYQDCVKEDYNIRRRPTIFPGLDSVLEGLHSATQDMKVSACGVYDATLGPLSTSIRQTIDNAMENLNRYEVNRPVYGGRDINGHTIRASEDPNRIIVIEPWIEYRSSLDNQGPLAGGPKALT